MLRRRRGERKSAELNPTATPGTGLLWIAGNEGFTSGWSRRLKTLSLNDPPAGEVPIYL